VKQRLEANLFGQHLAIDTIVKSINSHFKTKYQKKALVMSFQGGTGTGKTFAAQTILRSMYAKQDQSKFVHWFSATKHFSRDDLKIKYQVCVFL